MSEFDKVFEEVYGMNIDDNCKHRYEGAKGLSKDIWEHQQAKIDGLQNQIDRLAKTAERLKSEFIRPHQHDYDKGWSDCAAAFLDDLKKLRGEHESKPK